MPENIELQKLKLEERRFEEEIKLKKKELELREKELNLQLNQSKDSLKAKGFLAQMFSPVGVAVIVALFGLLSTTASLWNTSQIEDKKRQAELFLKWYERNDGKDEKQGIIELLNFKKFGYLTIPTETEDALREKIGLKKEDPIPPPSSAPVPQTTESKKIFWEKYQAEFGSMDNSTKDNLTQIFDFIKQEQDIKDVRYVAYILATIKWETAHTFKPITEFGPSDDYFESNFGSNTDVGKNLGNVELGDGVRFKGRGYLILNGRKNYELMNEVLKLKDTDNDLLKNPEKALDPIIAYRIASYGMRNGFFTGGQWKLSDFISDNKVDYESARQIVNGNDKAVAIADIARKFESILRESLAYNKN